MALRLRRGTDAERLLITPLEGELIYTTDTKKLYVGDGITLGGNAIDTFGSGGLADLSQSSINDLADVNADSTMPTDGDVLAYDATSGDWRSQTINLDTISNVSVASVTDGQVLVYNGATDIWENQNVAGVGGGVVEGGNYAINIVAEDSSLLLDYENKILRGTVYSEDGTQVLFNGTDGTDALFRGETRGLHRGDAISDRITATHISTITVEGDLLGNIYRDDSSILLSRSSFYGFVRDDSENIIVNPNDPTEKFIGNLRGDVTGNVTGNVNGDIKGSVFAEDSSVMIDATSGRITGIIETTNLAKFEDISIGTQSANPSFTYYSTATNGLFPLSVFNISNVHDDSITNEMGLYRARGTIDNQTIVQTGDVLGALTWAGSDGNQPQIAGCIKMEVNSVSAGNISADTVIATRNGGIASYTENVRFKADKGTVTQGYIQFGSYDLTTRASITPAAGMVIWNSATSQFEGFDGSNWINLVDGSPSP
jgi:hypothetical protein